MGISSAMNAGVMGLNVNSSKLSTISDNIANSETKGYKRTTMEFASLVLTERPTSYDAGGVRAATVRDVDDQGALLSTRNTMDLAISGRGFLPTTDVAAIQRGETDLPLKLMRTGSFRPDEDGIMRTNSGYALMGWKATDGKFTDGIARESSVDLVPVNIGDVALAAEPTSNISLGVNLDARLTGTGAAELPAPYNLAVEYFDVLGGAEKVNFSFQPMNATADANKWRLTVTVPNETVPVGIFDLAFATETTTTPPSIAGYLASVTGTNIQAMNANGEPLYYLDNSLTGAALTAAANLTTDATAATTPAGAGAPYLLTHGGTWDAESGKFSVTLSDGLRRTVDIGKIGEIGNLSQFKAANSPSNIAKNGSPVSDVIGIEINESGIMDAIFGSGFRKSIYKIPIGNVQNPNGLNALDGQVYTLSRRSGSIYFYDAGAGPTGRLVSSALEESTTDIAEELTQLIKTQRAYSSNAKIIQTVDEMLQETTNLKR